MIRKLDYNAIVIQRIEISPGLIILRVAPDEEMFTFTPGQYTTLGLKRNTKRLGGCDPEPEEQKQRDPEEMIRRAYSIASSSKENSYLDIYLALVSNGELTPRLFNLQIGDLVYLGPRATGMFTLDKVPPEKHVCLAATGTGLAPYISMVRTQLLNIPERKFVIVHGARYSWDLGYRDELISLERFCPNLHYFPVISRKRDDLTWAGHSGYVQDILQKLMTKEIEIDPKLSSDQYEVFLCGNPKMIEDSIVELDKSGFKKDERKSPGTIHVEEYW
ncbi:MAG: ferredoxin--NADP reductase [Candidatus Hinthialibacter antarcticus]|nr:ferredoxin--NADP reductase [Candidatus Hinthialibacter antarcticus]